MIDREAKILAFLKAPPRWFEWLVVGALAVVLAITLTGQATGQRTEIRISILGQSMSIVTGGGNEITIPVTVVIVDGISYVRTASGDTPLRLWLEAQGYTVTWSQADQAVIGQKE